MTQCEAVGELTVGGRPVAAFRCELEAGHARPAPIAAGEWRDRRFVPDGTLWHLAGSPHRYTLEWAADDDTMMLPEASLFDPDERFDVDVPLAAEFPCALCGAPALNVRHRRGCPAR